MHSLIKHRATVFIIAGLLSILLSAWISQRNEVINTDAICYLQSAMTVSQGIHAAMNVCAQAKWPFYAVIIHGLVNFTHVSYETAAYLIDGLFTLLTVLFFIGIVNLISQQTDKKNNILLLWLAAAVILLSHEFNAVKQYIVRDHGFWAFYLISLFCLLRFYLYRRFFDALAWNISLIIATLFRIEGAVFLALIPLSTFFIASDSVKQRISAFFKLNTISIVLASLLVAWYMINPPSTTGRLDELQFQIVHGAPMLVQRFHDIANFLAVNILRYSAKHEAGTILFLLVIVWYLYSVAMNISFIYAILVIYAWCKKLLKASANVRVALWAYITVNALITVVFLAQNMFLSKRYLLALSLVLMFWVPFALCELIRQWPKRRLALVAAVFFIVVSALGGIFDFGPSKKYIHDAGDWLAVHVPSNASIYTNDYQIMYYSKHFGNELFAKILLYTDIFNKGSDEWKQYDYLAIRVDKKYLSHDHGFLSHITLKPVIIFLNQRGDQIRIYHLTH